MKNGSKEIDLFRRQLVIKRKVVERNLKDLIYYRKEVAEHKQVLQQMEAAGRDASDIRQRRNVLTETLVMVPDAEERLAAACNDLGLWISEHMGLCAHAMTQLQEGCKEEKRPQPVAAAAAAAVAGVGAPGAGKAAGDTGGDNWLPVELAAAKKALLSVSENAPNLQIPLDLFEKPESQTKAGTGDNAAHGEEEI